MLGIFILPSFSMENSYLQRGLTHQEAISRLRQHGSNEIVFKREMRALKILLSQFTSSLIIILAIVGLLAFFLGETVNAITIFAIVIINSLIGFSQEYKAENAVAALRNLVIPKTIVLRDGQEKEIPTSDLVIDDIIILNEGDKIPADLEIIEAFSLMVDESVLTGESHPVSKIKALDRRGKLFKGTIITTGRAKAKVIATGMNTEFGKIISLVNRHVKTRSPLARQLDSFSKKLGLVILGLIVIIFIIAQLRGGIAILDMLMTSIALGVSAIPEGMPIIVTLTLAFGVQILARKKAIIRKMNSIKTLGATTIICSDKTGTLTLNEMTVKKIFFNMKEKDIPGLGYNHQEKISLSSSEEKKLMEICENCNNSFVGKNILGDPTEIALKILALKARYVHQFKKLDENVFSSERKMMSTLHLIKKGQKEIFSKGAYEEILKRCNRISLDGHIHQLTPHLRRQITKTADIYAKNALRVLGMAYKSFEGKFDEKNMIFIGLVGMIDPPRNTVAKSLKIAQIAGIQVKIITGDNPLTAAAIGREIGLEIKNIATGDQIDKLTDRELKKLLSTTQIFARTKPQHKYRIVDLLKKQGEVVAVTGDGVNDAPALKHADVGIAMGIKGTEATKEVADIVLKDDNFSTIVNTIHEGRRIYQNIIAFIKYMLSANFGSIIIVGSLTILGFPLPILPLQILWINIATDALPALALGRSEADHYIMEQHPHPKQENILKKFLDFVIITAILQTVVSIFIYFYGLGLDTAIGIESHDFSTPSYARTLVFTQIIMFELLLTFVCKDEKTFKLKSLSNNKSLIYAVLISFLMQLFMIYSPFMQSIFKTVPLGPTEWFLTFILAFSAFLAPVFTRLFRKLR